MSRLQLAIEQIVFARNHTLGLLAETPLVEWFRQRPGGVSHVGWQVGHLAFAECRMALWRIRGQQPQDDMLFPQDFMRLFGAHSVPDADSTKYPAPAESGQCWIGCMSRCCGNWRACVKQNWTSPFHPPTSLRIRNCWPFCGALTMR